MEKGKHLTIAAAALASALIAAPAADAHKVKGCGHVHGPTTINEYNYILVNSKYSKPGCTARLKRGIANAKIYFDGAAKRVARERWGIKSLKHYYGRQCLPYMKAPRGVQQTIVKGRNTCQHGCVR